MHLSDHDLRQMDEGWLENLPEDKLRQVSARILQDLKEARDRLNRTPDNSSRPPSSMAPWEQGQAAGDEPVTDGGGAEVSSESRPSAAGGEPAQSKPPAGPKNKPGKPTERSACLSCHQKAGSKAPQVDGAKHNPKKFCATCHDIHGKKK